MPRRRSAEEIENNRSRSRSRDNKDKSRSRESEEDERSEDTDENEAVASDIRNAFIEFFAQLKHEKGFVFTPQDRQKLIK